MTTGYAPPSVGYETDFDKIARVVRQPRSWVESMMIDRRAASAGSNMTALGLHVAASEGECFQVSKDEGLVRLPSTPDAVMLAAAETTPACPPPPHVAFDGNWNKSAALAGGRENLLGDNVVLTIRGVDSELSVPVVEATNDALGYYGARCVADGDVVSFPTARYPIWSMELGARYVDDFLLSANGKGFYLEYHDDQPHWHQPMSADCSGVYFMARMVGHAEGGQRYAITGFRIRPGTAVYTAPGAIHCDSALTGTSWVVGYRDSDAYSTALLRNERDGMVRLSGDVAGLP